MRTKNRATISNDTPKRTNKNPISCIKKIAKKEKEEPKFGKISLQPTKVKNMRFIYIKGKILQCNP